MAVMEEVMQEFAARVANALGEPWHTVAPPDGVDHWWGLTADGFGLVCIGADGTHGAKDGRRVIWGDISRQCKTAKGTHVYVGVSRPEISVRSDKSPEQVAKDISRRLLPDYAEALRTVRGCVEATDQYERATDETLSILAEAAGQSLDQGDVERHGFTKYFNPDVVSPYIEVGVAGDYIKVVIRTRDVNKAAIILRSAVTSMEVSCGLRGIAAQVQ